MKKIIKKYGNKWRTVWKLEALDVVVIVSILIFISLFIGGLK